MLNVVWFRRDLRITDHLPLSRAAKDGIVVPIYIAEPELWAQPTASAGMPYCRFLSPMAIAPAESRVRLIANSTANPVAQNLLITNP